MSQYTIQWVALLGMIVVIVMIRTFGGRRPK